MSMSIDTMQAKPTPGGVRRRRWAAEFLGTAMLVAVVVGSGIAAQRLSPTDTGLQLLQNSLATAAGLAVLILLLGPVSGAHINPVVSLAVAFSDRGTDRALGRFDLGGYIVAQMTGGIAGAGLASIMFDLAPALSHTSRVTAGHLIAEVVATAGLVFVVLALRHTVSAAVAAVAIGAYIGAAYWFTSSTSFANPAVTVARMFTDTFAGIAPASAVPFIIAQLIGATVGVALARFFYPPASGAASQSATRPASIPQESS